MHCLIHLPRPLIPPHPPGLPRPHLQPTSNYCCAVTIMHSSSAVITEIARRRRKSDLRPAPSDRASHFRRRGGAAVRCHKSEPHLASFPPARPRPPDQYCPSRRRSWLAAAAASPQRAGRGGHGSPGPRTRRQEPPSCPASPPLPAEGGDEGRRELKGKGAGGGARRRARDPVIYGFFSSVYDTSRSFRSAGGTISRVEPDPFYSQREQNQMNNET